MHWINRVIRYAGVTILFLIVLVLGVQRLPFDNDFIEQLYVAIFGSGIIAVAIAVFSVSVEQGIKEIDFKRKAQAFMRTRLVPDIREALKRTPQAVVVNSNSPASYLGGTRVPYLKDAFHDYIEEIDMYQEVLPNEPLLPLCRQLYFEARDIYVTGESINNTLSAAVYDEHQTFGVDSSYTPIVVNTIRDLHVHGVSRELVSTYSLIEKIPDEMIQGVLSSPDLKKLQAELEAQRTKVRETEKEILELTGKQPSFR